jgi:ribonuclease BN (tRNA processing enzyme)
MELVVLGSGTAVPHPLRTSSGYWLQTKSGKILLDLSASAFHRMAEENLEWSDVDSIWISHFHLDHCAGIAPFLFGTRGAPAAVNRTKPLKFFGAPGLRRLIEHFDNAGNNKLLKQHFPIEIVEIESLDTFEIVDGVEAVAYSTPHTPDSHALHLRDGDSTLVFSSDTGFDETLATFARRVDLFILESSFVGDKTTDKHLNLSEAIHLIRRAEPVRAMLTHFYADWDKVDFEKEVARLKPGCEVLQAFDGLKIRQNRER